MATTTTKKKKTRKSSSVNVQTNSQPAITEQVDEVLAPADKSVFQLFVNTTIMPVNRKGSLSKFSMLTYLYKLTGELYSLGFVSQILQSFLDRDVKYTDVSLCSFLEDVMAYIVANKLPTLYGDKRIVTEFTINWNSVDKSRTAITLALITQPA